MPIIISDTSGQAILASSLIAQAGILLNDEDHARWTEDELIFWINDAAREIILRRPAARAVTISLGLSAGTLQVAPSNTAQVLDVVRNIAADGVTPGRAIRIADRQALDDADPDWHTGDAGPTENYVIDERSPTSFYVYPPAVSGALVEALVSELPPTITSPTDALDMRAEFGNAIIAWIMYRCHTKDSEYAQGAVAAQHYQAFSDAIGTPAQVAQSNSATGNSQ